MKRLFLLFGIFLVLNSVVFGAEKTDYVALYENAQPYHTTFFNNVDPYQDEDSLKYAWSPYPLFRTSEDLYFKNLYKIEAGYYLLTPRKLEDKYYVLFKQNGKVKFIIPTVKVTQTPVNFYPQNTPRKKETFWNKMGQKLADAANGVCKDNKRQKPPQSLLKLENLKPYYVLHFYYGDKCYIMVFKNTNL